MIVVDGKQWIAVRKSNLRYYENVELYYRNPAGRIVLYKPAGMSFTDQSLKSKPYLGDLYIRPQDKASALQEAHRGFSESLRTRLAKAGTEGLMEIRDDLAAIVDETLSEPRSGGLQVLPDFVASIVDAYSGRPNIIKHLAQISHNDYSTAIHSINVMALTVGYCYYTKRSLRQTQELGLAGLLHDVGKVDVNPEILTAARRLTDAEFAEIARHPQTGAAILSEYGSAFASAIEGALQHHLKLDGSGYPSWDGPISETGRLIAIIDAYEALTNDERPYRSAMRPLAALRLLKEDVDAGKYDRKLFSEFAYSLTHFTRERVKPKIERPEIDEIAGDIGE